MTASPINRQLGPTPVPRVPSVINVTPSTATAWLGCNTHNRHLRPDVVEVLARDMANGRWHFTAEAIKFGQSGRLLDGQHRLAAVIRADVTVPMLVVAGIEDEAQSVMDTGSKRTAADMLLLDGEANGSTIAAAVRVALQVEKNTFTKKVMTTHSEIREWVAAHPEIRSAASVTSGLAAHIPLPPAIICYAIWRLRAIDAEQTEEFFRDLSQMRTEGKGDPRAALLQRLNSARASREQLSRPATLSLLFRAWNAHRKGQPMAMLKVSYRDGTVDIPQPV